MEIRRGGEMKDLKKYNLDDEALKNVSGGAGEGLDMDSMQEHWNQIVNNNVSGGAKDTFNPHSKKAKGKLYK